MSSFTLHDGREATVSGHPSAKQTTRIHKSYRSIRPRQKQLGLVLPAAMLVLLASCTSDNAAPSPQQKEAATAPAAANPDVPTVDSTKDDNGNVERKDDSSQISDSTEATIATKPSANLKLPDFANLDYTKGPNGEPVEERIEKHERGFEATYWEGGDKLVEFSGWKRAIRERGPQYRTSIHGYTDKNGEFIRHGRYVKYFGDQGAPDSYLPVQEHHYWDGKFHGHIREWYANGNKKREATAADDELHGVDQHWYPNAHSQINKPVDAPQQLNVLAHYKSGKLAGVRKEWHYNGTLLAETPYADGKKHGVAKSWHDNGNPSKTTSYRDGLIDGERKVWSKTGNLIVCDQWKAGVRHGLWMFAREDIKQDWLVYVDGELRPPFVDHDGKLVVVRWSEGKLVRETASASAMRTVIGECARNSGHNARGFIAEYKVADFISMFGKPSREHTIAHREFAANSERWYYDCKDETLELYLTFPFRTAEYARVSNYLP